MDALAELEQFCDRIIEYKKSVREYLTTVFPAKATMENIQNLRTELQRSYSRLESTITHYGGSSSVADPIFGKRHDVFDIAFDTIDVLNSSQNVDALDVAIRIVNKAIGKLQAEGKSWNIPAKDTKEKSKKAKAFISHSGITDALSQLRDFLEASGIEELLVVKRPHLGRSIDKKVDDYIDEADLAIFLATGDATDRDGTTIPSGNVIHEIGLAQATPNLKGKIIYLLEEGTEFPPNIKPKGYIRFNRSHIEQKFGDLAREITGMGF